MRRRQGFTLVELLVAMALIIMIMMILSEVFAEAVRNFNTLKSIGDMDDRLRGVITLLRRDLQADHFEGRRRTSDGMFYNTEHSQGVPQDGFFRILKGAIPNSDQEGMDDYGNASRRTQYDVLHFTIKLRGNQLKDFNQASIAGSPLVGQRTTYFDQPSDARYNSSNPNIYSCQWAEVAYFLMPNGSKATSLSPAGSTDLYNLYRCQYVVVADNTAQGLNQPYSAPGGSLPPSLYEVSCVSTSSGVYFFTPNDLSNGPNDPADKPAYSRKFVANQPRRRAFQWPGFPENKGGWGARGQFDPTNPAVWAATLVCTDVLSFDVQNFWTGQPYSNGLAVATTGGGVAGSAPAFGGDLPPGFVDRQDNQVGGYESIEEPNFTLYTNQSTTWRHLLGVRIIVRIWDQKSAMSRQMTMIQDL
jgi:prepilin-type N-terminal cleavage/methylation domain-containing protein